MASKKVTIKFFGGTETVTGSNFMLVDGGEKPFKALIDCGMFQGSHELDRRNYEEFPFDPAEIDYLFVTHAHMDHIGRIPKLVKEGFRGKIYSTPPTKDIAEIAFADAIGLMDREAKGNDETSLYDEHDVKEALRQWTTLGYHQPVTIGEFTVVLRDSGHILGSAMVEFTYDGKKVLFTGDLGNSPAPLLKDTEKITDISYLVMESVYGDRDHEKVEQRREMLEEIILETMSRNGVLLIPAFSIERTQELLFEIENMMEQSRIPLVPVFLDSPMAIKVTEVYKKYEDYLNKETRFINDHGDGVFKFPQFRETMSTEESQEIDRSNARKIIMAGSGMSNGGRIIHHEKRYLPDPKNTLMLVGYQAVGSLGRQIQDGSKMIKILGEEVPVNARVTSISGYSAHKDSTALQEFVQDTADTVKQVFVTMGEPKSSLFLVQRLRDYVGVNATVPQAGEEAEIEL